MEPLLFQPFLELRPRHRAGKIIALPQFAAHLLDHIQMVLRLNTLAQGHESHLAHQQNQLAQEFPAAVRFPAVLHKRAVHFDDIGGNLRHHVHDGVTGAEIVDGGGKSHVLQPFQHAENLLRVAEKRGLRQLKLQVLR